MKLIIDSGAERNLLDSRLPDGFISAGQCSRRGPAASHDHKTRKSYEILNYQELTRPGE